MAKSLTVREKLKPLLPFSVILIGSWVSLFLGPLTFLMLPHQSTPARSGTCLAKGGGTATVRGVFPCCGQKSLEDSGEVAVEDAERNCSPSFCLMGMAAGRHHHGLRRDAAATFRLRGDLVGVNCIALGFFRLFCVNWIYQKGKNDPSGPGAS